MLYAPPDGTSRPIRDEWVDGFPTGDYARLIGAADRQVFYAGFRSDIRPTTDDRPFFFHTTKLQDQFSVAFGRSMLFGNGLSALLTLLGISASLVVIFVILPLLLAERGTAHPPGWFAWLVYFGALGAGFMLIEVAVLQRFVLLLGHPVYSLTVTLFSLLLGTGIGAAWSRRFEQRSLGRTGAIAIVAIAAIAIAVIAIVTPLVIWAIPFPRPVRMLIAVATLAPMGIALGDPDADRHSPAQRPCAADGALGVGDERRLVGPRGDTGHLHRHELGLRGDPPRGLCDVPRGPRGATICHKYN